MTSTAIERLTNGDRQGKVVTAAEAVRLVHPGDTVAIGGFFFIGLAIEVIHALADFYETPDAGFERPGDLTLIFAVSPGDGGTNGANRLAIPGMVKRIVASHWAGVPALAQLVAEGQVEGYNLPLGSLSHLYRDIAAGKPGHLSKVGLGTFADPRFGGAKLNDITEADLVQFIDLDGDEYLLYKATPINVAIIRATTADSDGNLTMEREALTADTLSLAMAAHNSGGLVIAQVERLADAGTLHPRQVKVPGVLVDCVVVASDPQLHPQTLLTAYNPAFSAQIKVPLTSVAPMPMSARKVIARRAALELRANSVVNLGVGIPEGVAAVAAEEKSADLITLTAEPGIIGGIPAGGFDFGAGVNPEAVLDMPYQFDFYDGGGLDCAFLGLAQADGLGNVNVSRFGPRLAGAGGFINISQNAKKVVFLGTFTAGQAALSIVDGEVKVEQEGTGRKFVEEVEQRTFSGPQAVVAGLDVLYVTERCVFRLTPDGLELTEIAPGIDLQNDILDQMGFEPIVRSPKLMDARIFRPEPMGLRDELLALPPEARLKYDDEKDVLYLNFGDVHVRTTDLIDEYADRIAALCSSLDHQVLAVVNYDGFRVDPEVEDYFVDVIRAVGEKYFRDVTRYTTSAFMRAKLGQALQDRGVAPHIFESADEAYAALDGAT